MREKKSFQVIGIVFMMMVLSLLIVVPTAFAGYNPVEYTDAYGEAQPAVLARCNNNGYAVGWVGEYGPGDLWQIFFPQFYALTELPDVKGIICTDLTAPEENVVYYEPQEVQIAGEIFELGNLNTLPWDPNLYFVDCIFLPMDINDDNIIVGNVLILHMDDLGQTGVTSKPFIADGPQGAPKPIFGLNDNGEFVLMPANKNSCLMNTYAMGINNDGDIIGGMSGFIINGEFGILLQGFTFNKTDIEDDGFIDASELKMVDCGENIISMPLSINNSGMMTGITFSLKYPLANDSYIVDGQGNYLLDDESNPIPAGLNNLINFDNIVFKVDEQGNYLLDAAGKPIPTELCKALIVETFCKIKYISMTGFVQSVTAGIDDYMTINYVSTQDMENDQIAGTTEIYATVPYAILDSGQILLSYNAIDPNDNQGDAFYSMYNLLRPENQYDLPDFFRIMSIYRSNFPLYDSAIPVPQGGTFSGALTVIGDINSFGEGVGGYMDDFLPVTGPYPFNYMPDDGIDVMGIQPVGTINKAIPDFTWDSNPFADDYYLYIQNENQKTIFKQRYSALTVDNLNGTCSVSPGMVLEPGDYYWLARVVTADGMGPANFKTAFTVETLQVKPDAAILNTPTGTIGQAAPEFDWNAVINADDYYLYIQNENKKTIFKTSYPAEIVDNGDGTCTVNPGEVLAPGDYFWMVKASNEYGLGSRSAKAAFTVVE